MGFTGAVLSCCVGGALVGAGVGACVAAGAGSLVAAGAVPPDLFGFSFLPEDAGAGAVFTGVTGTGSRPG